MDISRIRKKEKEKGSPAAPPAFNESRPEDSAAKEQMPPAEERQEKPESPPAVDDAPEVIVRESASAAPSAPVKEATEKGAIVPEEKPLAEQEGDENVLELLTFTLSKEEFAFRVSEVEEIIKYQNITRVPTLPSYVCGITSLRGKIIPVVDLRQRLALTRTGAAGEEGGDSPAGAAGNGVKILILAGPKGLVGAAIDKVDGVVRFPGSRLLDPPAHLTEEELKYIEGVVILDKRFISVIRSEDALNIEVI